MPDITTNSDRDHLKVLSIFHFIMAGVAALAALFPVIHLALGIGLAGGFFPGEAPALPEAPEQLVGWFFIGLALAVMAASLVFAWLSLKTGVNLANGSGHSFCLAVACIECLIFPFGTMLGVVTLMILLRPSVKQLFGELPVVVPTAGDPNLPNSSAA
jgi:hypothetical protein